MAKFGKEIHTGDYNPNLSADTRPFEIGGDDVTSDIGIDKDQTKDLIVEKKSHVLSATEAKELRLQQQIAAILEYEANPPRTTINDKVTQPLPWQPSSPELATGMEKANDLQSDFNIARARLANIETLQDKEDLVDRQLHKIGMAGLEAKQTAFIDSHPVSYETAKDSIDPTRPDLWGPKQKAKFAQIVYALNKQHLEYKLSPDMPEEQQAIYKAIITAVKEGRYNPDTNSIMGKARNAIVLLAAVLAAQRMRAARAFRQRR